MTKEEAIRELKIQFLGEYDRQREAKDMAIKALEQEPCEDAVSRKAIEKLKRWRLSYDNNTTIPKSDLFVKLTDLRNLSSVTPVACIATVKFSKEDMQELVNEKMKNIVVERKKGKWILNEVQGVQAVGYRTYHCSECNREISSKYHGKMSLLKEFPYCHCGAKMESAEDA